MFETKRTTVLFTVLAAVLGALCLSVAVVDAAVAVAAPGAAAVPVAAPAVAAPAQHHLKIYHCKAAAGQKPLATIKRIEINNSTTYPIVLKRGQNATIEIEFKSHSKITGFSTSIAGELNGKLVPFQVSKDNTIDHIFEHKTNKKASAMLRNKDYKYVNSMHVKHEYPQVSVIVNYKLLTEKKTIFCFTFPAKIV